MAVKSHPKASFAWKLLLRSQIFGPDPEFIALETKEGRLAVTTLPVSRQMLFAELCHHISSMNRGIARTSKEGLLPTSAVPAEISQVVRSQPRRVKFRPLTSPGIDCYTINSVYYSEEEYTVLSQKHGL